MVVELNVMDVESHPAKFYYQGPGSTHRFALHSDNMIHLQLYFAVGKNLPAEGNEFEEKYPESDISPYFKSLSLPNWYKDTKKNFINIHEHTTAFHDQTLPRIFIFTGKISNNAEAVHENYLNLGKHITKMTNAESEIIKKKEIVNCKAICKELKTDAEVMEKEANSLYTALFVFEQATGHERAENDKLNTILDTELPVMVNAHAGLLRDVVALLDQAADLDKKYIDRCISACITPVFLLVPIFGWIAAPTMAGIWGAAAVKFKEKREEKLKEMRAKQTEQNAQYKAYLMLNELHITTRQVSYIIKEALEVLKGMESAFSDMGKDFDSILTRITKIESGIDDPDLWETALSPQKIKATMEKWKRVQDSAEEFRTVGPTKVTT
ncbi:hypothetical protein Q9L58_009746 [Maublancomyces gigas]|uniref:Uncharacterized protein n=1 Tax=Discina gigas TaxID=1032678 RepID=A0ABR3G734_9PEZI